jgi:hypothetical protein
MKNDNIELIYLRGTANKEKSFLNKKDDGEKIRLKRYTEEFSSFPIMKDEEDNAKRGKLEIIASHFAKDEIPCLNSDIGNLFDHFPEWIRGAITPKLLEGLPEEWFTHEFGFCYSCSEFKGYNKMHHKLFHSFNSKNRKVIPLSGRCGSGRVIKSNPKGDCTWAKYNNIVVAYYRCKGWHPTNLIKKVIEFRINKLLKKMSYSKESYKKDLEEERLIDFF